MSMQTTTGGVRRAGREDAETISATLAAAFLDDPVFRWILPDDGVRATVNRAFFDLVVDVLAEHDDAWTGADGAGAALWVPYGRPVMSEERAERFAAELVALSGASAGRMLEVAALLDGQHPAEPHEYLWFLGVRPGEQGRGIGSALLDPVLRRADAAGHPCYLEATNPGCRELYRRHGFATVAEIAVAGGPPLWPMWRDPR